MLCRALLWLAASAVASAQTPDTTTATRYFPLAVGNEWHTRGFRTQTDQPIVWTDTRHLVVSEEAPSRFRVRTTTVRAVGGGAPVETDTVREWRYDTATARALIDGQPFGFCPLNAPWVGAACAQVFGGYGRTVRVGTDSVITSVKSFVQGGPIGSGYVSTGYTFAAGLGHNFYQHQTVSTATSSERIDQWSLQYAHVDGQEYGQRLFPVAGEGAPPEDLLALTVGPNPAAGAVSLRYTLAAPGAVRLFVVDVLGRELAVLADGERPAGNHTTTLDASRLAPGAYVLVLDDGAGRRVSRLVTVAR